MDSCSLDKKKPLQEKMLTLYGGAYLNKGGTAIAYGTLKVLKELNIDHRYIIDPEPFSSDFFKSQDLIPIYRYSDVLSRKPMPSISPRYTFEPLIKCLVNSYSPEIRRLHGAPIWHIGDSPFSDKRSSLSIVGQVIALRSLKNVIGGKVVIGGISLGYPRTKVGMTVLRDFFKSVDHIFVRGSKTRVTLMRLNVPDEKMTEICDFAYHLNMKSSNRSKKYASLIKNADKPSVALILRDFASGQLRLSYLNAIRRLIQNLTELGYNILFIPTSYAYLVPENDQIFLKNILNINDSNILMIKDLTPEEIIHLFSSFDFIISARLHGAVYGTLANVPTIHLYEEKKSLEVITDIFGETIPLIKLSDFAEGDGLDRVLNSMVKLIRHKDTVATNIRLCIENARRESLSRLIDTIEDKHLLE